MAHYAWSEIKSGTAEKPITVKLGDSVTAKGLGIDDENFQALIDAGAVRDKKYPVPQDEDWDGSAVDYLRQQLAETTGDSSTEEASALAEIDELEKEG